jgi:hypothetical protein
MKYADLFHLKPGQIVLLITALAGAFLLGRCSNPESVKKPIHVEQQAPPGSPAGKKEPVQTRPGNTLDEAESSSVPTTKMAEQGEIRFDEQCRDIRLDAQYCVFPFLHPARSGMIGGTIICMAPEQKESLPRPVILLKPSGKKRRVAPPGKSMKEYFTDIFGKDDKPSYEGGLVSAMRAIVVAMVARSTICVVPEQKESLPPPVVLLKPSGKKKRIAPLGRSVQVVPLGRSVQEFVPDISGKDNGKVACEGGLLSAMRATVAFLESRFILYGIGPLSDCSGIFHRVLLGVKKRCPDHEYPSLKRYRDSRDLARWYHKQGELILIRNVLERPDLIRPGMVFFFGRAGVVYRNFTVKNLLTRRNGIRHVGVVTRVHKNTSGKVISYDLFHGHGRRGKTAASITRWHRRTPTRAGDPPFGNGREQLVAAARLVRP